MSDQVTIDLKEQLQSLLDMPVNLSIGQIGAIQWAIKSVAISKTETTSCRYCRGIESRGIVAVKTVIDEYLTELTAYNTPYNFCPNCGRKIKEEQP